MSSIEKLLIRGIRSFDPNEPAIVEFYSPLTLIVGHNGSGKTTIIECLKYITTGELPPNSKQGAFIHDPKLSNELEVKAQVKLKFRNSKKQEMVCTRSIQVTQKAKQIQQKSLESVLETFDPITKKRISLSTKCANLDAELPIHLGISSAILDNVIFCHQEESNWPLGEPATLKKKFDEIFASTRYTKALEHIRSLKKEREIELKSDLAWLKQKEDKHHRAELLQSKKETLQERILTVDAEVDKLKNQLEDYEKNLKELVDHVSRIETLNKQLLHLGEQKKGLLETLKELKKNIRILRTDASDHELEEDLLNMKQQLEQQGPLNHQLEMEKKQLSQVMIEVRSKIQKNLTEKGRLEIEIEHYHRLVEQRRELMKNAASFFKLDFSVLELTEEKLTNWIRKMRDQAEAAFLKVKYEIEKRHTSHQEKIQTLKGNLITISTRAQHEESILSKNLQKRETLNQQWEALNSQTLEIDSLQLKIKENEDLLTAKKLKLEELLAHGKLGALQKEEVKVTYEIARLNHQLTSLNPLSENLFLLNTKESLMKDEKSKFESLNRTWQTKHLLLDSFPSDFNFNVANEITAVKDELQALEKEHRDLESKLAEKNKEIDGIKTRLSFELDEITSLEVYVKQLAATNNAHFKEAQDFKNALDSQEQLVHSLDMDLQSQRVFKQTLDVLEKESNGNKQCKLCNAPLDSLDALNRVSENVSKLTSSIPLRLQDGGRQLDEEKIKLSELRESQPNLILLEQYQSKLNLLKNSDLNERLNNALHLKENLNIHRNQLQLQLNEKHQELLLLESILNTKQEIEKLECDCILLRSTLSDSNGAQLDVIQVQLATLNSRDMAIRKEMALENETIQAFLSEITSLQTMLGEYQSRLVSFRTEQLKKETYYSELNEVNKEIDTLQLTLNTLTSQKMEFEDSLKVLNDDFKTMAEKDNEQVTQGEQRMGQIESYVHQCTRLDEQLLAYSEADKNSAMASLIKNTEELHLQLSSLETKKNEIEKNIQSMQQSQSEWAIKEREILDNLSYREKQERLNLSDQQIQESLEQLREYEKKQYTFRLQETKTKHMEALKEHSKLLGEKSQLELNLQQVSNELTQDYADTQKDFRYQQIKVRTSELANKDLEQYAKALDTAIMKYHTLKMDEVNKIIRELWVQIYQGNDIETVEIRSDKESTRGFRQFSYRIVMISHGRELEMRGRCSAGQKVLASLVIRMALAESFSSNCGILALDEPTTNLDRENIEALAEALHTILHARQHQSNFQLIIITHDEDFVRLIGKSEFASHYIRVFKNKGKCSKLERVPIETL
ncbi:DNA repair protein rad50 [Coelomomyces lativittatus]|nr:DNA repair protein rad50 [Coelomomyces lativittatus]KAJ1514626.1 DNA repair protein rad50 [Coelomomyces lativittatus]KAJ1516099.1 DNA repair protein rad50 [Coelomomyces lativittatus]